MTQPPFWKKMTAMLRSRWQEEHGRAFLPEEHQSRYAWIMGMAGLLDSLIERYSTSPQGFPSPDEPPLSSCLSSCEAPQGEASQPSSWVS